MMDVLLAVFVFMNSMEFQECFEFMRKFPEPPQLVINSINLAWVSGALSFISPLFPRG